MRCVESEGNVSIWDIALLTTITYGVLLVMWGVTVPLSRRAFAA